MSIQINKRCIATLKTENQDYMKIRICIFITGMFLLAIPRGNAQSIAAILTGGDSREWELRKIDLEEGTDWESEEFGDNDEFEENSEFAQLIPETIVFHANGTCELLYVSYFLDEDDTPYDNFTDSDLTVRGRWQISGNSVVITEPDGWTWAMKNLDFLKDDDDGGYDFECKVAFECHTNDIEEIVFDWWPDGGGDDDDDGGGDDDDDDDGGGSKK